MRSGILFDVAVAVYGVVYPHVVLSQNPPPIPPATPPAVSTPTQPTAAQQAAKAATGKTVSNEQISAAIRQSGLSQDQIQARLKSAGYDPSIANPFFGTGVGGVAASQTTGTAGEFAQALQSLGLLSAPTSQEQVEETARRSADRPATRSGGVFGKDIFSSSTTVFDPITAGPVDPAYRLGVGDQLQLVVTGQVELAQQFEIRRDGTVIIPQVGQVALSGLTLDAARTVVRERMARSFSSLNTGDARLDLSISRIRSNAVFVIGEVEAPGAYQVNALSTVFHAIARAGGPTDRGSFRGIEVRRGRTVIQRLDLYDYLLVGDAAGDIRLEQGDVIFVPLNTRVVAVVGQVRRPRIFELKPTEGFRDLLRFAGEMLPTASVERVQIDRIVPPDRRSPGFERVKVDVEIKGRVDSLERVSLLDGDIVQFFSIGDVRRNVVSLGGQVFQPGEFELRPGATLGSVIQDAQGLLPWALSDRVKVIRQLPLTGRSIVHSIDVTRPAGREFLLEEFDAIEVLDSRVGFPAGSITVEGAVNGPSTRAFVERESLRDAIERSGGLREEAQLVEVFRRRTGEYYNDTTSIRFTFPVVAASFVRDTSLRDFIVEREDHIVVRASPGFREQRFVNLKGQFGFPGTYAINESADRVRDLVLRAGDVLPGAYPDGFHLVRDGRVVSVDFARAMRGDPSHNIPLLGGDQLQADRDPNTVLVTGAVSRPGFIKFDPRLGISAYLELAGGPTESGNAERAVVLHPSGYAKRVKSVALFFHTSPKVVSGSTITVPERPVSTTSSSEVWQRVFSSATALASLVLAYAAATK